MLQVFVLGSQLMQSSTPQLAKQEGFPKEAFKVKLVLHCEQTSGYEHSAQLEMWQSGLQMLSVKV